ncbi:MAG: RagB/SusD family nutrient uptake outer membrane protein, partial [Segetibacter sp.]
NGFAANDKRKPVTIAITTTPLFNRANVAYVNKYAGAFGAAGTTSISDANQILLRLSDVILMRAEALNELNTNKTEVIALLTRIRDRAFGAGINNVPGNSTQDELRKIILQERYLEFAFEGHRWFDLVRTDQVDDVLGVQFPELLDSKRWTFPILESIINANPNIVQNPGWQ